MMGKRAELGKEQHILIVYAGSCSWSLDVSREMGNGEKKAELKQDDFCGPCQ